MADITQLEGLTGKVGREDIGWGEEGETFSVPIYSGGTTTLEKIPSIFADEYSNIKGASYVSNSSLITDHGDAAVTGSLAYVIAQGKTNIVLPAGNYYIITSLTVPDTVKITVLPGALFILTGTLTLNCEISAGVYRIFNLNVGTLAGNFRAKYVFPQWFDDDVGDGSNDDTAALNAAFAFAAGSSRVKCPAPVSKYKVSPLTIPSNTVWIIEQACVIETNAGYGATDKVVNLDHVENVYISGYGATFQFDIKPTTDEQRHIFMLDSASDVTIEGVKCLDGGGDGFYIGGSGTPNYSSNITLRDCIVDNCRRQGISITAAKNVLIDNLHIKNITGTNPQCGIDIEPNIAADLIEQIIIKNTKIETCTESGILITGMAQDEEVSIFIQACHISDCRYGIRVASSSGPGAISINNCMLKDISDTPFYNRGGSVQQMVDGLYMSGLNSAGLTNLYSTGVLLRADLDYDCANVKMRNIVVDDSGDDAETALTLYVDTGQTGIIKNIDVELATNKSRDKWQSGTLQAVDQYEEPVKIKFNNMTPALITDDPTTPTTYTAPTMLYYKNQSISNEGVTQSMMTAKGDAAIVFDLSNSVSDNTFGPPETTFEIINKEGLLIQVKGGVFWPIGFMNLYSITKGDSIVLQTRGRPAAGVEPEIDIIKMTGRWCPMIEENLSTDTAGTPISVANNQNDIIEVIVKSYTQFSGQANYNVDGVGPLNCGKLSGGSNFDCTSGTPTGTSGTAGKVTLFASTSSSGLLTLENRSGAAITYMVRFYQ